MELPKEFEERMRIILGNKTEYEAFIASMEIPPVRALRVNTLKMDCGKFEDICDFEHEKLSFSDTGYIFSHDRIGAHPLHHAGAVYIQEPAAMAALECTEVSPGMRILDICASPGGKSTQAAARLCGEGLIVSNEIDGARCSVLAQNIERMGVRNAAVTNTDSGALADAFGDMFDLVIADAPCSGEGMMRKNPLAVLGWSMENIEVCVNRQREILENASRCVKKGGRLLYSTCTFAPEENEMRIAEFLSKHKDFRLVPVSEGVKKVTSDGLTSFDGAELGGEMKLCRRFYPHVSLGEGQFMALMERDGENAYEGESVKLNKRYSEKGRKENKKKASDTELETVKGFLSEVLTDTGLSETEKYELCEWGGMFYLVKPELLTVFSGNRGIVKIPGVPVGEVKKGRVIPHHSFFMAYGDMFRQRIDLGCDDDRICKYLHGESIFTEEGRGFGAVLVFGASVGGVKISSGEAKNYYPKGLRV